jgi:glycosyltransferase involved in cell wall biosynthesis
LGIGNYSEGYGMPSVVHSIAKELADKGHNVSIIAGKGNLSADIPTIEIGYTESIKQASITRGIKAILELKPDIFHSHYYPMDLCGALVSYGTLHVMHVHGVLNREYWVNIKAGLECIRSSLTESIGISFSAKVIAISEFLKENILKKYRISSEKIEVIYPAIDLDLYSPINRSKLLHFQPYDYGVSLICVGAIAERKGQHFLVEAMREVVKEEPNTRLLLIGRVGEEDRSYIFRLQDRIKNYGLEKNIITRGFIPTNLIPKIYAQADIFVTGTMWEGFGMPIAEAMATGIPVVAFDTASMHELIINNVTGFKVPPFKTEVFAENLLCLIQDSKLRKKLGRNGRGFAEKEFDAKKNINRLIKIYQSLF